MINTEPQRAQRTDFDHSFLCALCASMVHNLSSATECRVLSLKSEKPYVVGRCRAETSLNRSEIVPRVRVLFLRNLG